MPRAVVGAVLGLILAVARGQSEVSPIVFIRRFHPSGESFTPATVVIGKIAFDFPIHHNKECYYAMQETRCVRGRVIRREYSSAPRRLSLDRKILHATLIVTEFLNKRLTTFRQWKKTEGSERHTNLVL